MLPGFAVVSTDIEYQVSPSSKVTFLKQSLVAEGARTDLAMDRVVVGFYFPECSI